MQEVTDIDLLRDYAEGRSEKAFGELVARHVNKVYSAALRHTRNPSQAEEITHLQSAGNATFAMVMRPEADTRQVNAAAYGETTNKVIAKYGLPIPEVYPPGKGPIPTPAPTPIATPAPSGSPAPSTGP